MNPEWGNDLEIPVQNANGKSLFGRVLDPSNNSELSRTHGSPQAKQTLIILVHGLGEHSGRYEQIAKHLSVNGCSVLAYDHQGHGRSPGKRGVLTGPNALVDDLESVIQFATTKYPDHSLGLLGHSMGGLVVARHLADQLISDDGQVISVDHLGERCKSRVQFCILSSPALSLHLSPLQKSLLLSLGTLLPKFTVHNGLKAKWLSNSQKVVSGYQKDPLVHSKVSGELVQFMLNSIAIVQSAAPKWVVPTLLMYASEDKCVDSRGADLFTSRANGEIVESHRLPTNAHEIFAEEGSEAIRYLQEWLDRHVTAQAIH